MTEVLQQTAAMTRDDARELFKAAGLTYESVTRESLKRLRSLINQRMRDSRLFKGTFRCKQRAVLYENPHGRHGDIRCRAYYFDDREAVTFNADGFIGFAGWASDENVQPILFGFADWVREMSGVAG